MGWNNCWLTCVTYNTDSESKFKTSIQKLSLCDYSDGYMLIKETETIPIPPQAWDNANNNDQEVVFWNSAPFTNCLSEINNTQINNAKDIDIVMTMNNLIEYSDNYSKRSESLRQYYRDEPFLDANDAIADFPDAIITVLHLNLNKKIAGKTANGDTKYWSNGAIKIFQ